MLYVDQPEVRSATFWVAKIKGKAYIVTALHTAELANEQSKFYISLDDEDLMASFEDEIVRTESIHVKFFHEVKPVVELLQQRRKWIEDNQNDPNFASWNCDVEFGLQPHPVLDVSFFHWPAELDIPSTVEFSDANFKADDNIALIAYHYNEEDAEAAEYKATLSEIPSAQSLLHGGKSVSLGKIKSVGPIATAVMTTSIQSSGGLVINDSGKAVAISFGSFWDE
ncbi:hypothetical protein AKO1_002755, partial [Acrasis kona]